MIYLYSPKRALLCAYDPDETPDEHGELTATFWYPDGRYAAPLTFDRIWRYDLRPVDDVERAHYMVWLHADRDARRAALIENDWRELSGDWATDPALLAEIEDMARHDTLAAAALVLWEAAWKPNTTP